MNSGPPELEEIYVFGNQLVIYYLPRYHTLPELFNSSHSLSNGGASLLTDWDTHLLFLRHKIVKVYIQAGWVIMCSDM